MIKYPIGIQTFEEIIEEGYAYVDKTGLLYRLVTSGKYYFLKRPRRFGKSLLVSTLDAYFRGKKELFKGLAIWDLEKDWESYPVIRIDLSKASYDSTGKLRSVLSSVVDTLEGKFGVTTPADNEPDIRFDNLIRAVSEKTGKKVVVLVDEYDAPLVENIDDEILLDSNRKTLSGFYKNIKGNDDYVKFALLTGVTKFGHVNVFSALNNLTDISMDKRYQAICGITEEELRANFDGGVAAIAEENGISKEECYRKLEDMYDGYHFVAGGVGIYNPFSVLNALSSKNFGSYWFRTGTPTGLILALRKAKKNVVDLNGAVVSPDDIQDISDYKKDIIPLLYQSGYLTIKDKAPAGLLRLGFPNREVETGFVRQLVPLLQKDGTEDVNLLVLKLYDALNSGDVDSFISEMQAFIAGMYYEFFENTEQTFQSVFYIVSVLLGAETKPELHTNRGRIDLVTQTKDYIYVIEFKLDGTPEEALSQIKEKGYADQWKTDKREKFLVGVNFSSEKRNIPDGDWIVERLG